MSLAAYSVILAVATLVYTASQPLLTLLLTHTQSWEQKRSKLRALRWFWRITHAFSAILIAVSIAPLVISIGGSRVAIDKANAAETDSVLAEEVEAKRVVKESQTFETLGIYGDPRHFDHRGVDKYWLPGSEAMRDLETCINRLNHLGWHYGVGARLISFEFRHVRIFGDHAEVGTVEHWYLPMVHADGSPVRERNPDLGPYEVDYGLTRVNGRWLLATTTTPYIHKSR